MLRSQQEVRLFGQRYGAVFAGLGVATAILIVLLILNFPRTQGILALIIFALLGR
jgi:hypothetical protein